jgi:hypothetical protein
MTTPHASASRVWVIDAHARVGRPIAAKPAKPSAPAKPSRTAPDRASQVRQMIARLRPQKAVVTAEIAVGNFLRDMALVSRRTFPDWRERLVPEIEACCTSFDARRALLDVHPLDDYYFAGVVALAASRIRSLFPARESAELLSVIGEQVAGVAGRTDRLVPDLVFAIIIRLSVCVRADQFKRDYDQVCKFILEYMGVGKHEATRHLMRDGCYRHNLGEPLARGIPQWWSTFAARFDVELRRPTAPGA